MDLKLLKEKLERFEHLEEEIGVEIKNISFAFTSFGKLKCFFEIYSDKAKQSKNKEKQEFKIIVTAYDSDGDIMATDYIYVTLTSINFQVEDLRLEGIDDSNAEQINKIRIYPKLWN